MHHLNVKLSQCIHMIYYAYTVGQDNFFLLFIRDIALNSSAQHIIEPDIDQEQKLQLLKFLSRRWDTQAE